MLYEFECWSNKKDHEWKMKVVEMRVCGGTLLDRVPNSIIRNSPGVVIINKKFKEDCGVKDMSV